MRLCFHECFYCAVIVIMHYFSLIVCCCFMLLASQAVLALSDLEKLTYEPSFNNFIQTHNKIYATQDERNYRFGVFVENMKRADELQKSQLGTATYGATRFADLTAAEFKKQYGTLKAKLGDDWPPAKIPNVKLPKAFDWRKKNVLTEVKDQGFCGSCWAFSTTGNIESLWAIKHKKLISLSEQELLDCDTLDDSCNGGYMQTAYKAIIKLGGLELESNYEYKEEKENCKFKKSKVAAKITGGVVLPENESKIAKWVYKNGPVSVGLNSVDMQLYTGGIAQPNSTTCDPTYLDHGVLIVGFGAIKLDNKKLPFWIVKNSWGSEWGESGYYRVHRGSGACGINTLVSSATL